MGEPRANLCSIPVHRSPYIAISQNVGESCIVSVLVDGSDHIDGTLYDPQHFLPMQS